MLLHWLCQVCPCFSPDLEFASWLPSGIVRSMIETLTCEQRIRTLTSLTTTKRLLEFNEYEYRCCELRRCPILDLSSPTPQVRPSTPSLWQMHIVAATLSGIRQTQASAMDRQCGKPRPTNGKERAISRAAPLNKQGAE